MAIATEGELLTQLTKLYARRDNLQKQLIAVEEEVSATETDLTALRHEILSDFLTDELATRNISHTLYTDDEDNLLAAVTAQPGGEVEYSKMTSTINWSDFDALPVILLLNYLGKGLPWSSEGAFI